MGLKKCNKCGHAHYKCFYDDSKNIHRICLYCGNETINEKFDEYWYDDSDDPFAKWFYYDSVK